MTTILYSESLFPGDNVEREIFGPDVRLLMHRGTRLCDLPAEECAEADAVMVLANWVTAGDLDRMPRLRLVVRMAVGYDRIDRKAAAARGITVCNVPDYGVTDVADFAMGLLLALRRGIAYYHDSVRADPPGPWWVVPTQPVRRMAGQRLALLGLGRIGLALAARARAFGMEVTGYARSAPTPEERALGISRAVSLDALLDGADALSLHVPLTPQTRGLIGARELHRLARDAVVINTARGEVLDLDALEAALREGHLAGAGLDVLPGEPPDEHVPALLKASRAHEKWLDGRLIITPHVAYHSPQAWADMRRLSAETAAANLLHGTPCNVIPPDAW